MRTKLIPKLDFVSGDIWYAVGVRIGDIWAVVGVDGKITRFNSLEDAEKERARLRKMPVPAMRAAAGEG